MGNKLLRLQTAPTLLLSVTTLLWLPAPAHAQSTASQDRDSRALPSDDITRRDLARFDQFLEGHREIAAELRRTPSLIDDPEYLQNHPELNTYLQQHPGVKQEISQRPDDFMRLEDRYDHDRSARDRDASGPDRDAGGGDRGAYRRDLADFDRFLDEHREIAEQVRKDPSLLDNREFLQSHPALQSFLQNNPGVRDQLRRDPTAFMRQEDRFDRSQNGGDRYATYRMADFGGFLGEHSDIQRDLSRNPSVVKDHAYVENHAELNAYLSAHPDVRDELMANPQSFVKGAQHFSNGSAGTASGAGVNGSGSGLGTTAPSTGNSTNPEPQPNPKPKQ
jgi:hypothetical protein